MTSSAEKHGFAIFGDMMDNFSCNFFITINIFSVNYAYNIIKLLYLIARYLQTPLDTYIYHLCMTLSFISFDVSRN